MKAGAGGDRELILARVALELVTVIDPRNGGSLAPRTGNPIWPAESFQVPPALDFAVESPYQASKIDNPHHRSDMTQKRVRKRSNELTTEEAIQQLFHADLISQLRKLVKTVRKLRTKKA
ncbi:MAG TPA: hypothetical protein VK473_03870 [Terriglobales bacterium]|nr:hypothetical protein [Terriglobales bacterium]